VNFLLKFYHSFNPSEPGYVFMWILLTAGIFCVAIAIERFVYLRSRAGSDIEPFMKRVLERAAKDDIDGARQLCSRSGKMALAEIIDIILTEARSGEERIRRTVEDAILRVVPKLEKRSGYLGTIGNVATLIGLMGTIYGLIISFSAVGKPGIDPLEKSTLLASGIAAAMNTTFMGLMVAIPSIVLYSIFKSKTQQIIDEIDEHSLRITNTLVERSYETTFNRRRKTDIKPHGAASPEKPQKTAKYNISASSLKDSVSLHVTGNRIKIFADDKLLKEIET